MTNTEQILWKRIVDFEMDDDTSAYTFSDRLAVENGWTHEFTLRAIQEYKKFMFLICTTDGPLTPSDQVDQVWHLHLLYTRSYWKEFCGDVLEREIHHGPTRGGTVEQEKFADLYERTLSTYKLKFNMDPPDDVWPSTKNRFAPSRYQRVDLKKHWIIKKPFE